MNRTAAQNTYLAAHYVANIETVTNDLMVGDRMML